MNTDEKQALEELYDRVIQAVFEVSNVLGSGFLEKVYERALMRELAFRGVRAKAQVPMRVHYKGKQVGDYYADILVDGKIVIELKCVDGLRREHLAQCLNYLRATGLRIALLVNFQKPRVEHKRILYNF
jgi:GxxExxY protein